MSTTILTPEQVGDLYQDWHCFFKDNPGSAALCIRAIEQAVLQSPEVQALRRLAKALDEKIDLYERYGPICEFEGESMIHATHLEELRAAMERKS